MSPRFHWLSNLARVAVIGGALVAAAGSAGSQRSNASQAGEASGGAGFGTPSPRAMQPQQAIGLWRSSFGPVKIEVDPKGIGVTSVQGAWRYMRGQQEVIGLFWGTLRGNVLEFDWQEPNDGAALRGKGYLQFDAAAGRFVGKWWTSARDRYGDWNGWRQDGALPSGTGAQPADVPADSSGAYPADPSGGYPPEPAEPADPPPYGDPEPTQPMPSSPPRS